ncbi:ArsR/SmtB family transcription factor [Acetobacteroides hydrogenigenes]|uniref:DNA-binding transcriptional ArsR family regulator n=1 Tax=Acetobacteroides hydrogenigenes TaxID=979970 RepID=A0A4R2EGS9_9BACT|nr:metalloregulator ArsR/SmtB family transcription factor [Acetobacteroides hydrogenigenes]TCN66406.1 DNA-binding transcriptional ArsR family regulator [Acetobacteroides hydrogenigenes]
MGTSKYDLYSDEEQQVARYAKALSHPARVAILRLLYRKQTCICGDIVEEIPLSQSTVSQHLKELKDAGLVKGDIDGVKVCYCINEEEWNNARRCFGSLLGEYTGINSCQ